MAKAAIFVLQCASITHCDVRNPPNPDVDQVAGLEEDSPEGKNLVGDRGAN